MPRSFFVPKNAHYYQETSKGKLEPIDPSSIKKGVIRAAGRPLKKRVKSKDQSVVPFEKDDARFFLLAAEVGLCPMAEVDLWAGTKFPYELCTWHLL
jgi:hypothetical protein